jgi:16S rRNA (guanine966-N2)-methyltransferase
VRTGHDRPAEPTTLRIIGGRLRGRKLLYSGDARTRPMKDRVREALFNLIGNDVRGIHAIDLFAGTGALGLEAMSRGAARATFIEQHFPTAAIIRKNIQALDLEAVCQVTAANTLIWFRQQPDLGPAPWLVFCSPPFDFYIDRRDDMLGLLSACVQRAPAGSVIAVECDERFDLSLLPCSGQWDVRSYPPAVVAIYRTTGDILHLSATNGRS